MPRPLTDEAIVLKAYNVGETDRFCVLLTKTHGRMTLRAPRARKSLSRSSRGLLPLYEVAVTWEQHSFGNTVTSSECLDAHRDSWKDAHAFSCAAQGIELLLKLTEDGLPMPDVYALTNDFLRACDHPHPPTILFLYALKLLKVLGYLPASSNAPLVIREIIATLDASPLSQPPPVTEEILKELSSYLQGLVGNQLGVSLKSSSVRRSISSGVTPTCQ